jgi:hypothetical protein
MTNKVGDNAECPLGCACEMWVFGPPRGNEGKRRTPWVVVHRQWVHCRSERGTRGARYDAVGQAEGGNRAGRLENRLQPFEKERSWEICLVLGPFYSSAWRPGMPIQSQTQGFWPYNSVVRRREPQRRDSRPNNNELVPAVPLKYSGIRGCDLTGGYTVLEELES